MTGAAQGTESFFGLAIRGSQRMIVDTGNSVEGKDGSRGERQLVTLHLRP